MSKFIELVKWAKDQRINKGMVLIKLFAFFYNMGFNAIFPYLTLQMINIGLSYEDVSYIYGAIPAFTFFTSPIAGLCLYRPKIYLVETYIMETYAM
jgi:hypothetical protein